ncbi:MAG: hypothetical protein JXB25_07565 [Deltaproteobacteria bacterium]|nr:hypothetical protein [Deltaproteobacteria bacterium]
MGFELLPAPPNTVSAARVTVKRRELGAMIGCVRALYRLSRRTVYRDRLRPQLPECGRFDPGHDAVMMGYDFHLTPDGPQLIEVNTNAGGLLLPWLPQAGSPAPERCRFRLLESFAQEFARCSGQRRFPRSIAIVDDTPLQQFLYPEMLGFARLFEERGAQVRIVDPGDLESDTEGVRYAGERIDFIYNRHTDFYLESPALAGIRAAYLAGKVCLSPNPFSYALLADKRRLPLFRDRELLRECGLPPRQIALLARIVPDSTLLADADPERVWEDRAEWVFKPVSRFASRGVILGKKISRKRFAEFPPEMTLLQRYAPPSPTEIPGEEPMKTDLRLFVYRDRVLAVLARLYRGQVTNMQTPGGGFALVAVAEPKRPSA